MSLDYLIPLITGIVMLAVPVLLLTVAWRQRPASSLTGPSRAHKNRTGRRQAYLLSRRRALACFAVSLFSALIAGIAMATWLPLAQAESALLATLIAPLLWAGGLVLLLIRPRWRRDCLLILAVDTAALTAIVIPLGMG